MDGSQTQRVVDAPLPLLAGQCAAVFQLVVWTQAHIVVHILDPNPRCWQTAFAEQVTRIESVARALDAAAAKAEAMAAALSAEVFG